MTYTVRDIVAITQSPARSVRRDVEAWAARQHDPRVPRVERRKPGAGTRGGRPAYHVDADSFERWRRGELRAAA
jgi:hypothetical protein